jgi:hypothetical protein
MYAPTDNVPYPRPLIMRILVRKFVYRHHPKAWAGLAFAAGTWLLILGVILCAVGYWWGAALIAVAALESWVAIHLVQSVQN